MPYPHTIWQSADRPGVVETIDQRLLPFREEVFIISNAEEAYTAIREMVVRGAPLIGVTAAYGLYAAACSFQGEDLFAFMHETGEYLKSSRPTAVNLAYAVDASLARLEREYSREQTVQCLMNYAEELKEKEIGFSRMMGEYGLLLIREISRRKNGQPVNILTHCNAGRLATVELGTATAPIYLAHAQGVGVHVWVDETRPRNQGARLTAFELGEAGIPHTIIADNTGGHLMQHGLVDLVIVGSDRTTVTGDVANKIGTYLKALAAKDNGIPFWVALPSSSIDWTMQDGLREIPIETRDSREVSHMEGLAGDSPVEVRITPAGSPVVNYGFDVTPARLVTGLITERGLCDASAEGLRRLFPEKFNPKR